MPPWMSESAHHWCRGNWQQYHRVLQSNCTWSSLWFQLVCGPHLQLVTSLWQLCLVLPSTWRISSGDPLSREYQSRGSWETQQPAVTDLTVWSGDGVASANTNYHTYPPYLIRSLWNTDKKLLPCEKHISPIHTPWIPHFYNFQTKLLHHSLHGYRLPTPWLMTCTTKWQQNGEKACLMLWGKSEKGYATLCIGSCVYTRDSDEGCSITHDNWILHKHAVRVTFVHRHHMDLRNQLPQYLLVVVHALVYS